MCQVKDVLYSRFEELATRFMEAMVADDTGWRSETSWLHTDYPAKLEELVCVAWGFDKDDLARVLLDAWYELMSTKD